MALPGWKSPPAHPDGYVPRPPLQTAIGFGLLIAACLWVLPHSFLATIAVLVGLAWVDYTLESKREARQQALDSREDRLNEVFE